MEMQRKAEEEQMEARRKELLSEEDGYWRRRMVQDAQQQALQEESIVKSASPQVAHSRVPFLKGSSQRPCIVFQANVPGLHSFRTEFHPNQPSSGVEK